MFPLEQTLVTGTYRVDWHVVSVDGPQNQKAAIASA